MLEIGFGEFLQLMLNKKKKKQECYTNIPGFRQKVIKY